MIKKGTMNPGDILLFRPRKDMLGHFVDWAQRVMGKDPSSKLNYCHIAIVCDDRESMYQAIFPKSKQTVLDWDKLDQTYYVELWRVKKISNKQVKAVLGWSQAHLGEWYDLGIYIFGLFDFKNTEVCSTFVEDAFKSANIIFRPIKVLNDDKHIITPDEIAGSGLIKRIV